MNIGVCVKSTPDTDTRIKVGDGDGIDENGIKWIISPYDDFAVEAGVQTKEKLGGEAILFTVGPDRVQKNLRDGLAVGAGRAVHVDDPALAQTDNLGVAKALAKAIAAEDVKLVFCGRQAIDDDAVQVPAMLAELLGFEVVSFVCDFSTDGETFQATRSIGGGIQEVVTGNLPVVISTDRGLNTPRYAKLPDIMKAKRKKITKKDLAALGLGAEDVAPAVSVSAYGLPPGRPSGRILSGDTATVVKELVRVLREEAKVL